MKTLKVVSLSMLVLSLALSLTVAPVSAREAESRGREAEARGREVELRHGADDGVNHVRHSGFHVVSQSFELRHGADDGINHVRGTDRHLENRIEVHRSQDVNVSHQRRNRGGRNFIRTTIQQVKHHFEHTRWFHR